MSIKILLLEDDTLFAESLIDLLEDDYEITHTFNGQEALDVIFKNSFELYILDINVPLIKGTTLLRELREANDNTPAIFLTSHKDKEMLKDGFLSGCDDYITKPFDNDELLLRVGAIIKRNSKKQKICAGALSHDTIHKQIYYKENLLDLSKKEYELLALLINYNNKNLTKEIIISELWNPAETPSEGAIRVYINRLKQILPDITIINIRGIGYKLVS